MAQQKISNIAICPECDGPVQLAGKLHIGQRLLCRRCGLTLMITNRKPLELDLAVSKHSGNGFYKTDKKPPGRRSAAQYICEQSGESKEDPQMSIASRVFIADCPECDVRLRFHKPLKLGQLMVCPECEETLEVISLHPLALTWADESPWDYEDYDNIEHRYHS
jgi:lysine biosynthesis protein LysW